jgi:hypothetical protein
MLRSGLPLSPSVGRFAALVKKGLPSLAGGFFLTNIQENYREYPLKRFASGPACGRHGSCSLSVESVDRKVVATNHIDLIFTPRSCLSERALPTAQLASTSRFPKN